MTDVESGTNTELLQQILSWIRISAVADVKKLLETTLDNENLRIAYQLSDGERASVAIAKTTALSQPRISELWKEWVELGLGDSVSARGGSRFRRSFDLNVLGILDAKMIPKENSQQTKEPEQVGQESV